MDPSTKGTRVCEPKAQVKKSYGAPKLTVHGTVAQITKSINPGPTDGFSGSSA